MKAFPFLKILLLLAVISAAIYYGLPYFEYLDKNKNEEFDYLIFIATIAIAIIAYQEFERSHRLTSNEFLLFTSNRWGNSEIIMARQIIHKLFVDAYRDKNGNTKCEYSVALISVAEKIIHMSKTANRKKESFIYLLNLLDYLEVVSYFYVRGDLKIEDVKNTCGNNAIFWLSPK